jgi:hypothetical protein
MWSGPDAGGWAWSAALLVVLSCIVATALGGRSEDCSLGFLGPWGWVKAWRLRQERRATLRDPSSEPESQPRRRPSEPSQPWPFAEGKCSSCGARTVVPTAEIGAFSRCPACAKK